MKRGIASDEQIGLKASERQEALGQHSGAMRAGAAGRAGRRFCQSYLRETRHEDIALFSDQNPKRAQECVGIMPSQNKAAHLSSQVPTPDWKAHGLGGKEWNICPRPLPFPGESHFPLLCDGAPSHPTAPQDVV